MKPINTVADCIFDVHFESNIAIEILLAHISMANFDQITKLPISQIPEPVRKNDPNLKIQPLYEFRSESIKDYKILLGDSVLGIAIDNQRYTSWTKSFFPQIKKIFEEVIKSKKIESISRLGLRYVDFLPNENIFETGKINININRVPAIDKKMFFRVEDKVDSISYNKIVLNNVEYNNREGVGSIIDITTFIDTKKYILDSEEFNIDNFFEVIDNLHTVNKDKFKEVISDGMAEQYGLL